MQDLCRHLHWPAEADAGSWSENKKQNRWSVDGSSQHSYQCINGIFLMQVMHHSQASTVGGHLVELSALALLFGYYKYAVIYVHLLLQPQETCQHLQMVGIASWLTMDHCYRNATDVNRMHGPCGMCVKLTMDKTILSICMLHSSQQLDELVPCCTSLVLFVSHDLHCLQATMVLGTLVTKNLEIPVLSGWSQT